MMKIFSIKNNTTGKRLTWYEFHNWSMAEKTAGILTRKSKAEGKNEMFIVVSVNVNTYEDDE